MGHWISKFLEEICDGDARLNKSSRETIDRIGATIEGLGYYMFRSASLEALANELLEAESIDEFSKIMWSTTVESGFQNFVVFAIAQGQSGTLRSRICTSFKTSWIRRYEQMEYQFIDPILIAAVENDGMYVFSEKKNSAPAVKAFWDDAERYGIGKNGVCFSMTRSLGCRIGVSFLTTNSNAAATDLINRYQSDLSILSAIAADTFRELSVGDSICQCPLSERELRFLYTLVTATDPTEAFKINSGYGSNATLQASIRSKLEVTTVFQAISMAASKGWFDNLPYTTTEVQRPFPPLETVATDNFILTEGISPNGESLEQKIVST